MAHFVGAMLMADLLRHARPSTVREQLEVGFVLGVDPYHALSAARIVTNPDVTHSKPVVEGTRITMVFPIVA